MEHIIALDAGTTGVTALLFDTTLVPVARAYAEFPQHFPSPGEVEHDAQEILAAVDQVLAEVLEEAGDVLAIGLTNQRETLFAVERSTGRAIGRGLVWQDRRTSARCAELRQQGGTEELVRRRTGLVLDPYFSGTKAEWLLREREGVRQAQERGDLALLTVDALLVHHLTGGELVATDWTNASRTMLYDIEARSWCEELCELFGVQLSSLPEVRSSTASFGTAQLPGGRRVPLRGIAGDQQAALFGQGALDAGGMKNTYGTGCFLLLNTGQRRVDAEGLLTTLAVGVDGQPCFALEGSVFTAGAVVQWLRDQLGLMTSAAESEELARSVEDTGGVFLVPAFAGLGAPYWDADARAALLGMTRGTSRAHIVRAGLDSIAFQCAELVELLRTEAGMDIAQLRVDGGAAANDYLMQRQADLAGVRIERVADVEATARGAAALAGVGIGAIEDPAALVAALGTSFEPQLGEDARRAELNAWRSAVQRVRS